MNRLQDKNFVVTGASGLLGQQHTLAILSEGGKVAMLDLNSEGMHEFVQSIPNHLIKNVLPIECNVSLEKEVITASNLISNKLGIVHGLVNNAAINASVEKNLDRFERLENLNYQDWTEELDVGLWGSVVCARVFGSKMVQAGVNGSVVNISSDHGLIAPNQNLYKIEGLGESNQPVKPVTYSVIKHGLIGLTRYLATYWADNKIRVNALCPGGVLNNQEKKFVDRVEALIPLGRLANPNEYWGALIYLLSDESSYMTGSVMVVDGGRSAW